MYPDVCTEAVSHQVSSASMTQEQDGALRVSPQPHVAEAALDREVKEYDCEGKAQDCP